MGLLPNFTNGSVESALTSRLKQQNDGIKTLLNSYCGVFNMLLTRYTNISKPQAELTSMPKGPKTDPFDFSEFFWSPDNRLGRTHSEKNLNCLTNLIS